MPPNCKTPGGMQYNYNTSAQTFNGTERVIVERWTYSLNVSKSVVPFEGDPVTFTATASSGTVHVRQWLWRDTSGVTTPVPCTGTSPVCVFTPPMNGKMFVRAVVSNLSFWIQQAQVEVPVLPIIVSAVPNETFVRNGDSTNVHITVAPSRPVTALSSVSGGACSIATMSCKVRVTGATTYNFNLTVNGIAKTCGTSIDTLPCPTGFDVDNHSLRTAIDSVFKLTNYGQPSVREISAVVYDSAGFIRTWYLPPGTNPCQTADAAYELVTHRSSTLGDFKILYSIHTHPYKPGDVTPSTCAADLANRNVGRGPSTRDWATSTYLSEFPDQFGPDFRNVVVDPNQVWSYTGASATHKWKKFRTLQPNGTSKPDSVYVPDHVTYGTNLRSYDRSTVSALCIVHKKRNPSERW